MLFPIAGIASKIDAQEAWMVGETAVKTAVTGDRQSGSIIIVRTGTEKDYSSKASVADLSKVAKVTKDMPEDFINKVNAEILKEDRDSRTSSPGEAITIRDKHLLNRAIQRRAQKRGR